MANSEHLQILLQGVETWNTWRRQNEDISPDLSSANLAGANLTRDNLSVITKATGEASRIIDHRTEGDMGQAHAARHSGQPGKQPGWPVARGPLRGRASPLGKTLSDAQTSTMSLPRSPASRWCYRWGPAQLCDHPTL